MFLLSTITIILLATIFIFISTVFTSKSESSDPKTSTVTLGSKKEEVQRIMGKPDEIQQSGQVSTWHYGDSLLNFDATGHVAGWSNNSHTLRVSLGEKQKDALFKKGSSVDEVVNAMGTPDKIINWGDVWYYNNSTIHFNEGKVILYSNLSGNLNIERIKGPVFFKKSNDVTNSDNINTEAKEKEKIPSYEESRDELRQRINKDINNDSMVVQDVQELDLTDGKYPELVVLYTNEYGEYSEVLVYQYRESFHNYNFPQRGTIHFIANKLEIVPKTKELIIKGVDNKEKYKLINNHLEQTYAEIEFDDGSIYKGQMKNEKMNGSGTLKWPNGERYDGEFINDVRTGYGVYIWPDGTKFEGQFKNDEATSSGKWTYP